MGALEGVCGMLPFWLDGTGPWEQGIQVCIGDRFPRIHFATASVWWAGACHCGNFSVDICVGAAHLVSHCCHLPYWPEDAAQMPMGEIRERSVRWGASERSVR